MTLITYPTRVHFADDVLEEALHSELDRAKSKSILLVSDEAVASGEFADRVRSGLPSRAVQDHIVIEPDSCLREISKEAIKRKISPDTVVAFGSSAAIELGRKLRFGIDQSRGRRPSLFAVPGVDGLPDPCNRNLESKQAGLPEVVICDPSVSINAQSDASQSSTVMSLVRCMESYLSSGYNPPADGMALDGISRSISSLEQIGKSQGIELHREIMAASLNAFLSQDKGVGPAQTMTASLLATNRSREKPAIARLLTPGLMRQRSVDSEKANVLAKVLSRDSEPLADATARILGTLEMPPTLASIGVPHDALDLAAKSVEGVAGLTFRNALSVLEEVYEDA